MTSVFRAAPESAPAHNIHVFVDGKQVAIDVVSRSAGRPKWNPGRLHDNDACYIGFESHQGDAAHQKLRFGGVIDEVVVFSRAVTEAEVALHAKRPR